MEWLGSLDGSESASISAVAAAVSALAAMAVALLTILLLFENRRLRKAGNSPEIVAYLAPHPDGHGGVNFILANVGTGPAFDVKFEIIADEDDLVGHNVLLKNDPDRSPIGVIPQNERIVALLGISFVLYGKTGTKFDQPLRPFQVKTSFKDGFHRKRVSTSHIDIRQFAGLAGVISKPPITAMSETLKRIEKHLGKVARESGNFAEFVNISKFEDEYVRKAKAAE